jgi:hypothetical protein
VTIEFRNPPRFRRAPTAPSEMLSGRCEVCESFANIGFCVRYQLPVFKDELCDSFVIISAKGNRQLAEP